MAKLQVYIGIYYGGYLVTKSGDSIRLSFWPQQNHTQYLNKRIAVQCISNSVQEVVEITDESFL